MHKEIQIILWEDIKSWIIKNWGICEKGLEITSKIAAVWYIIKDHFSNFVEFHYAVTNA